MMIDNRPFRLGAYLFQYFELLDLYGPLEMFGNLKPDLEIVTVAQYAGPIASAQGPKTIAEFEYDNCPELDLILVPGGFGTVAELENPASLNFIKERAKTARITMSVCTGSWMLARTGLLDGRRATSNKVYFKMAEDLSDKVTWIPEARWVEDGPIFTASGVTAGMDMSLAVIEKLFGHDRAMETANGAEYVWQQNPALDPFFQYLNASIPQ